MVATLTLPGSPLQSPLPVFDVRAYGAVGDGTTSDTLAIQRALTAANPGGGIVFIPPGVFLLSGSALTLGNNVMLQGSGTSSILKASTTTSVVVVSGVSNWAIRDFYIEGNASAFTVLSAYPTITLVSAGSGLIANMAIANTITDGINGIACTNVRVEDCSISSASQHGVLFGNNPGAAASRFVKVRGNHIHSCGGIGIYYYAEIRDSTIEDNTLFLCDDGIRLTVISPNSAQSTERITIAGNVVTNCKTDGIRLMGSEIACTGNISSNNSNSGIRTGGSAGSDVSTFVRSTIVGNSCSSNSNMGIGIIDRGMNFITIADNTVMNNRGNGINFGSLNSSAGTVEGGKITGNNCNRNGFHGIALSDHTFIYFSIANNTCSNNGWNVAANGITCSATELSTIQGNVCYDNQSVKSQQVGIQVGGSSNSCNITGNITRTVDHATGGTSITGTDHEVSHNIL